MRASATFALLAIAGVASCHLFLESRGLQPDAGGGGGDEPVGGAGGTILAGGGGVGGDGGAGGGEGGGGDNCHDAVADCVSLDGFAAPSEELVGSFGGGCTGPFGTPDDFGDPMATEGNWQAEAVEPDAWLQSCGADDLTITPNSIDDFWYREMAGGYDDTGPYVYQYLCGPFAAVTRVTRDAPTTPPAGWIFRGVGLVVADPGDSRLRHVQLSMGHHEPQSPNDLTQPGKYGSKVYTTPVGADTDTSGVVVSAVSDPELLGVCRPEDGTIHFFIAQNGSATWVEVLPPASGLAGFDSDCCVRVGLTATVWAPEGPRECDDPLRGSFDWVGFTIDGDSLPMDVTGCPAILDTLYNRHKEP